MGVTVHTPSITILLHKWCRGIERIAALRAEKVSSMPFGSASYYDLTFDRCLARLAAGREHLVEVEMAEEALRFVGTILML
jgi:hypothetical protein